MKTKSKETTALLSRRSTRRVAVVAALLLVAVAQTSAAPTLGGTNKAMMYLAQYGYLSPSVRNPSRGHIMDLTSWRKAIADFQSFAGLNATGELDEETETVMALPRCGVKDKVGFGESRAKRYAIERRRWSVKNLIYKISKYPSRLHRAEVDAELAKAFKVWSKYTDLTFTQKRTGQAHIEIRFEKEEHGDGSPFDGPGNTLAHAFRPEDGGNAHFDDAEMWSINSRRGINLYQVAAHEFGHSLGLKHSDVNAALMAPFYIGYEPNFQLHKDDVLGIQAIYGRKSKNDIGGDNSLVRAKAHNSKALRGKSRFLRRPYRHYLQLG